MKITLWHKLNKKTGKFEYNHYSEGVTNSLFPTPESEQQRVAWDDHRWAKEQAFVENQQVIHKKAYYSA